MRAGPRNKTFSHPYPGKKCDVERGQGVEGEVRAEQKKWKIETFMQKST